MEIESIPKSKRREAEVAAEWYAAEVMQCVVSRKAIRSQWQKVDFFACDVVAKREDGSHVYLQVTTGKAPAVSTRKKKLTKIPWHKSDTVQLLQLVANMSPETPKGRRMKTYYFKVYEYLFESGSSKRGWVAEKGLVHVPKEWFKRYKEKE